MNDDELITLMKEPFADVHMTIPADEVIRHGRTVRTRRRRLRGLTGAVALSGSAVAAVALLVPGGQATTARLAAWTVSRDPDGGITVTVNQMTDPGGLQATLRADGIPARVTFAPVQAMTQPLPAGCTAPKMSGRANAQLQNKILMPPAIVAWQQQQEKQQQLHPPTLHVTYRVNGHVEHATLLGTPGWQQKLQQLLKEHHAELPAPGGAPQRAMKGLKGHPAALVQVSGGGSGAQLPNSLQTLQEKETQDPTGRTALYINPAAIPAGIGLSIGVDVESQNYFSFGVDLVVTSPQCTGS